MSNARTAEIVIVVLALGLVALAICWRVLAMSALHGLAEAASLSLFLGTLRS
jgi:hypothetical protein